MVPPELMAQLKQGRVIAFIGAGFSAPAGFPGWKELILKTASAACEDGVITKEAGVDVQELLRGTPSAQQLDQAAQLIQDALHETPGGGQAAMVSYLRRMLTPKLPLSTIMERRLMMLRELPFAAILTTNFNPLLRGVTPFCEAAPAAYRAALRGVSCGDSSAYAVASSFTDESGECKLAFHPVSCPVIQLHGALDEPQSVVLTREGYRRLLYACPAFPAFLKSSLACYTYLFLGDPTPRSE
jgi:hypothetical protein